MMANFTQETTVNCRNLITDGLTRLFNDQATSDVTIVVGNQRFYAHKTILAASSDYFLRMFYGSSKWNESTRNEVVLHEPQACEDIFDVFIRYFYSGIVKLSLQNVPHLLMLADKYDAQLKYKCLEFMTDIINKGNLQQALIWIPTCDQIGAHEVLERCYFMICLNFQKVCKIPEWVSLPFHYVTAILERPDLVVSSEYDIFVAVQSWILSQQDCPPEMIEELLSHVDFSRLPNSNLDHVKQSLLANDARAASVLRSFVLNTVQSLAITAENDPMQTSRSLQRCYVCDRSLRRIRLSNRYAFVTPLCGSHMRLDSSDVVNQYTWVLSYNRIGNHTSFMITVPKVSREMPKTDSFESISVPYGIPTERSYLHNDIPGIVRVGVLVLLKNSQGVTCHIGKVSTNTSMPQVDGEVLVEIPLKQSDKGDQNIPNDCLVSFEINKP